jgi:hypothetical protein
MKMDIKLNGNKLEIDIFDLTDSLDRESLLALADSVSISDAVIKNVIDQVCDGSTEMGSWGYKDDEKSEPKSPISIFRRQMAIESGRLAEEKIYALEGALKKAAYEHKQASEWAWKLWHHIGDKYNGPLDRPEPPKYNLNYSKEVFVSFNDGSAE